MTSKVRRAIKQVLWAGENKAIVQRLREAEAASAGGGGKGMDPLVDRLFEQAQVLYRRWPEVGRIRSGAPRAGWAVA